MFYRIRSKGPDGRDIINDTPNVPGPVGLLPKQTIAGYGLDSMTAHTITWGNGLQGNSPEKLERRRQRKALQRQREVAA